MRRWYPAGRSTGAAGRKCGEALCRLLPNAGTCTPFHDPAALTPEVRRHKITTSFLNRRGADRRALLPLMPVAPENSGLRGRAWRAGQKALVRNS